MKRWLATFAMFAACSAAVLADVTIVQTTTIDGGMAAMSGQAMSPTTTTRIKGLKSRSDIDSEMIKLSGIADLETKQVIVLSPGQKTAQVLTPASVAGAVKDSAPGVTPPVVNWSINPTGKSQVIDGFKCDEYTFSTTLNMSEISPGGSMPPEAADMMKAIAMSMNGSMWVAKDVPGAADYVAFQKAAAASDLASLVYGAAGLPMPGVDRMLKAIGSVSGVPYLIEMTMSIQGAGQMAEMMPQAGPTKVTSRVKSISTDPISDDIYKIPQGYTVVKQ